MCADDASHVGTSMSTRGATARFICFMPSQKKNYKASEAMQRHMISLLRLLLPLIF